MKVNIGRYPKDPSLERKISIKIEPFDTWSLDHTLSLIIHPALVQLKRDNHGFFMAYDEDVPEKLRSHNAPPVADWETDALAEDRYNWIMDEMIWAMEHIVNSTEYDYDELWIENAYRCDYGCRLFGKYFQALWD